VSDALIVTEEDRDSDPVRVCDNVRTNVAVAVNVRIPVVEGLPDVDRDGTIDRDSDTDPVDVFVGLVLLELDWLIAGVLDPISVLVTVPERLGVCVPYGLRECVFVSEDDFEDTLVREYVGVTDTDLV